MEWMDLQEVKRVMNQLREQNYHDSATATMQKNMEVALSKIQQIKTNCLEQNKTSQDSLIERSSLFLKAEAEIIGIINCLVYCDFTNKDNLEDYLEEQILYAHSEYIQDIEYLAKDFHTIAFLPQFYYRSSKRVSVGLNYFFE